MSDTLKIQNLSERLADIARKLNICNAGLASIKDSQTKDALVDYYLKNPDWCMERLFPSYPDLCEYFSDEETQAQGVFVGKTFKGEVFKSLPVYVFHNCRGLIYVEMDYENANLPLFYFGNECRMRIKCKQESGLKTPLGVTLYSFGKNQIQARNCKFAKFIHHKHNLL